MSKKISKVRINDVRFTWGSNPQVFKEEEITAIKLEDLNDFSKYIKNIKFSSFSPGESVYFDDKVIFPRRKFQKAFPTSKIVNSGDKADVIIIDKRQLESEFNWNYGHTYYRCISPPGWTNSSTYKSVVSSDKMELVTRINADVVEERINNIYGTGTQKIVDITDINLPSDEELTPESYERISKMFTSSDDAMKNMAMRLLTAYDYDKDKAKIALMLNSNWSTWANMRDKKTNVEVDAMLRRLQIDYPGYQYGDHFLIKLALDYPEDPVMSKAFNLYLKRMYPGFKGNVKLVISDE